MALMGFNASWREALTRLLDSDQPIRPAVRMALSDAIKGQSPHGITVHMKGHEKLSRWSKGVRIRREWMETGRFVRDLIEGGEATNSAFLTAAEQLRRSEACLSG
jgi:hypothetical protein